MESPKVFISYSWTTPEHEQRVLDIATELVESGIDAILDKWDLKEGDDADGDYGVGSRGITGSVLVIILLTSELLQTKRPSASIGVLINSTISA
jgi:hypothetical protein